MRSLGHEVNVVDPHFLACLFFLEIVLGVAQNAVSGSNIFLVWEDRTVGNNEIFFARGSLL